MMFSFPIKVEYFMCLKSTTIKMKYFSVEWTLMRCLQIILFYLAELFFCAYFSFYWGWQLTFAMCLYYGAVIWLLVIWMLLFGTFKLTFLLCFSCFRILLLWLWIIQDMQCLLLKEIIHWLLVMILSSLTSYLLNNCIMHSERFRR